MKVDLYSILDCERNAEAEDLKKSFRSLALQHHPDKNPDDPNAKETFQRIGHAYSILSDPVKRAQYDKTGTTDEDPMSPDDLSELFQSVFMDIFGGISIKSLFRGLSQRQIKRMPPFPFPKELFPPNTFPPGVKFSKRGMKGMPSDMMEALLGGGAGRAAASFFSQSPTKKDNDDEDDEDDDGWETVSEDDEEEGEDEDEDEDDEESSADSDDDDDDEEEGGSQAQPPSAPKVQTPPVDPPGPDSGIDKSIVKEWFDAAKSCSVGTLSALFSRHPSLLLLQGVGLGHTALHWLAARGDPGSVAWILSLPGAQVNVVNSMMQSTPLHSAAGNGKDDNVRLLLSRGADATMRDADGRDAAMVAKEHGHEEIARLIREWRRPPSSTPPPPPPPSPPSVAPATPPPPAASSSLTSQEERARRRAQLLAEAEAAEKEEESLEAQRAEAATRAAAASGVDPAEGRSFMEAAKNGEVATLLSMLEVNPRLLIWKGEGTNYAFTGHTALHWAAARGHGQLVRWLVEVAGADARSINASGSQPIHSACDNLQMDCVAVLVLVGGSSLCDQDGLGSSARDLMVARGASEPQMRKVDLLARASALIRASEGGEVEQGGVGIQALQDNEGGQSLTELMKKWSISAMRTFLVSSGISASSLPLEKKDLQSSCHDALLTLIRSLPPLPNARRPSPPSDQAREDLAEGKGLEGAVAAAKAKGNKAFAAGQFKQAISHYTMALNISQTSVENAVLFSNRSAANCKLSLFGSALEDANSAISLDPGNPKYWVRKGCALQGQGRIMWGEAREAFEEALRLQPGYEAAVQGLKDLMP